MRNLSDQQLLAATAAARHAAHDAPKLDNGSRAWADRANEWMRLANEVDRRGLKQPPLSAGSLGTLALIGVSNTARDGEADPAGDPGLQGEPTDSDAVEQSGDGK